MRKFPNYWPTYFLSLLILICIVTSTPALGAALDSDTGTCLIINDNGLSPAYKPDYQVGDRSVIYFDLTVCQGYPSELVSVKFSLVDIPGSE